MRLLIVLQRRYSPPKCFLGVRKREPPRTRSLTKYWCVPAVACVAATPVFSLRLAHNGACPINCATALKASSLIFFLEFPSPEHFGALQSLHRQWGTPWTQPWLTMVCSMVQPVGEKVLHAMVDGTQSMGPWFVPRYIAWRVRCLVHGAR